jgi:hypothetical protein
MKQLKDILFERLVLSKHKKNNDITLSLWVRWYGTPPKDGYNIIPEKNINAEHICNAITHNNAVKMGFDDAIDFYDKHKDDYLEDFNEIKKDKSAYNINFTINGIQFSYLLSESFEEFIKHHLE